jgi:hypothetical protein
VYHPLLLGFLSREYPAQPPGTDAGGGKSSLKISPFALCKGVRSQAKDSKKAKVEQDEFDEELSKWESRLPL